MQMKRHAILFGAALLLTLLLNILPFTAAAADNAVTISMSADQQSYTHGDEVIVSIAADGDLQNKGKGITVFYDDSALTLNKEKSTAQAPLEIYGPLTVDGKTALRISCFPGEAYQFDSDKPLATLTFDSKAPSNGARIEMAEVHQYEPAVTAVLTEEVLVLDVAAVPVSAVQLNKQTMKLEIEKNGVLCATVLPENASDKTVTWISSDKDIVTVQDGKLTAVGIGEATITATAGDCVASCVVTVVNPPDVGYVATMPKTARGTVNGEITIAPIITNDHVGSYNAYDLTFSYNPQKLMLLSESTEEGKKITATEISATEAQVNVLRYGDSLTVGEESLALKFRPLVTGTTEVVLLEARVDYSQNALIENVSKATVWPSGERTEVIVGGYPVTLDNLFAPAQSLEVEPGENFEFTGSPNYEYKFTGSVMGGQVLPMTFEAVGDDVIIRFGVAAEADESSRYIAHGTNGKFIVENVTGPLVIEAVEQGKTYGVTINGTGQAAFTGAAQARYMQDYELTKTGTGEYLSPIITIGGEQFTAYTQSGAKYIIPGNRITGEIFITINRKNDEPDTPSVTDPTEPTEPDVPTVTDPPEETGFKVTVNGKGVKLTDGDYADGTKDYAFQLEDTDVYDYTSVVVLVGNKSVITQVEINKDTYTIPKNLITADITIETEREAKTFAVSITGSDVTGEKSATYSEDYQFKLSKKSGYTYKLTVTIAGKSYTDYETSGSTYTIPGEDIRGKIVIKVTRTKKSTSGSSSSGSSGSSGSTGQNNQSSTSKNEVAVTFVGSGAADANGQMTATLNQAYTFRLDREDTYRYSVSAMVGAKSVMCSYDAQEDTYTIAAADITDDVVITVEKKSVVEVTEYLTLEGRSIFLVAYHGSVGDGDVPQYDGHNMYRSDAYDAYVWLICTADQDEKVQTAAAQKITVGKGQQTGVVVYDGNVNLSGTLDISDAYLVWDIYNGKYDLDSIEMIKLLSADLYHDKKVNMQDVAAIAHCVLVQEEGNANG